MPTNDERNLRQWRLDSAWIKWWCYMNDSSAAGLARALDLEIDRSSVVRWKKGNRAMNADARASFQRLLGVSAKQYARGPHGQK